MRGEVGEESASPEFLLNFQVKNAGFYSFYCENLLVARNWDQGMLNGPAPWVG